MIPRGLLADIDAVVRLQLLCVIFVGREFRATHNYRSAILLGEHLLAQFFSCPQKLIAEPRASHRSR
jgi:hypothetical protein